MQYDSTNSSVSLSFANGTSVAAPGVAYAASLIYRLRQSKLDPVDVKKRIIFSADIDGRLDRFVKDGRVLNISRAVNMYSDAVTKVKSDHYLRGVVRLGEADSVRSNLCDNPLVTDNWRSVAKIARIIGGSDDGAFLMYLETGGTIRKVICRGTLPKILFTQADSNEEIEIKAGELLDVTFGMKED
jgi:hypothetical protein